MINGLAIQDSLEKTGIPVRTMSALSNPSVSELFIRRRALRHLEKGRVIILVGGTGNPYMTTDTAAALRALEISADLLMMSKNDVDGVYDSDPKINPKAKKSIIFLILMHYLSKYGHWTVLPYLCAWIIMSQ